MKKLLLFFVIFPIELLACSFRTMILPFQTVDSDVEVFLFPEKPQFVVSKIERGFNDGSFSSCSDAGIISFKLLKKPKEEIGYRFQIQSGQFEDLLFSNEVVVSALSGDNSGLYQFIWLDGSNDKQEPIDLVVEITPVSKSGLQGMSQLVTVQHSGR